MKRVGNAVEISGIEVRDVRVEECQDLLILGSLGDGTLGGPKRQLLLELRFLILLAPSFLKLKHQLLGVRVDVDLLLFVDLKHLIGGFTIFEDNEDVLYLFDPLTLRDPLYLQAFWILLFLLNLFFESQNLCILLQLKLYFQDLNIPWIFLQKV